MSMKTFRTLTLLVGVALLTGCASQKFLPDGTLFSADTVTDSLDRSATVFGLYQPTDEKLPDGKPKYKKVANQLVHGPTITGQALIGASNGVGAAFIQQHTAIRVAKKNSCNGPTCGNGTVIINDGQATAVSNAQAGSATNVDVRLQGACQTGACW